MTNEAKQATHTPGPWYVVVEGVGVSIVGDGVLIATMEDRCDEDDANACLVAAAPDLLEALQAYVANDANQGLDDDEMYANAIAAIAKATGA